MEEDLGLDLSSEHFDAARALRTSKVKFPELEPNTHVPCYDNLAQWRRLMLEGHRAKGGTREIQQASGTPIMPVRPTTAVQRRKLKIKEHLLQPRQSPYDDAYFKRRIRPKLQLGPLGCLNPILEGSRWLTLVLRCPRHLALATSKGEACALGSRGRPKDVPVLMVPGGAAVASQTALLRSFVAMHPTAVLPCVQRLTWAAKESSVLSILTAQLVSFDKHWNLELVNVMQAFCQPAYLRAAGVQWPRSRQKPARRALMTPLDSSTCPKTFPRVFWTYSPRMFLRGAQIAVISV